MNSDTPYKPRTLLRQREIRPQSVGQPCVPKQPALESAGCLGTAVFLQKPEIGRAASTLSIHAALAASTHLQQDATETPVTRESSRWLFLFIGTALLKHWDGFS